MRDFRICIISFRNYTDYVVLINLVLCRVSKASSLFSYQEKEKVEVLP